MEWMVYSMLLVVSFFESIGHPNEKWNTEQGRGKGKVAISRVMKTRASSMKEDNT